MTFISQSDKRFNEEADKEENGWFNCCDEIKEPIRQFFHSELRAFAEKVKEEIEKCDGFSTKALKGIILSKLDELIK